MTASKKLTRRQAAVIEDLFTGRLDEREVLEKHHVSPSLFERWQQDERFVEHLEHRIACAQRRSRMILARSAAAAADTLTQLTKAENAETARKACLDILSLHRSSNGQELPDTTADLAGPLSVRTLPPETTSRLLAALAQEKPKVSSDSA